MNKQSPIKLFDLAPKRTYLFEEIRARDAYSDFYAIRSLLSGKRDTAFVDLNKDLLIKFKLEHRVGVLPVRMISHTTMKCVLYTDKAKGERLFQIAKSHDGHLDDQTPEEAREIGELLGYAKIDIDEYIQKQYSTKVPLRTDTADDYNDLDEQNFPEFEKEIKKDEAGYGLNKRFIGKFGDVKVYAVNADFVRDTDPGLGFNGFTDGGSHYVTSLPGYKKIPEDEIWIDDVFLSKPNDFGAFMLHELLERHLMKFYGVPYDTAHADYAEKAEPIFREKVKNGMGLPMIEKIYNEFVTKYAKHHKPKNLNENFQFNKMMDLFKRVI